MFVGHYAVSFAMRREAKSVPSGFGSLPSNGWVSFGQFWCYWVLKSCAFSRASRKLTRLIFTTCHTLMDCLDRPRFPSFSVRSYQCSPQEAGQGQFFL